MKYFFSIILFWSLVLQSFAQTPQLISYQGIARDSLGIPLINRTISLRLSLLNGSASGSALYVESHILLTNNSGMFNLQIGGGNVISGQFSSIDWGAGSKWLKTEMDSNGSNNYIFLGTSQLLSVPYALYSGSSASAPSNKKAKIRYQLPSGTDDINVTTGIWTTRTLNTIVYDDIGVSLASNIITLPPGTYEVSAFTVFNNGNSAWGQQKLRILNLTNNSTLAISLASSMSVASNQCAYLVSINDERFTTSSTTNIALQYFLNTVSSFVEGFDLTSPNQPEVYAEVILTKIK